MILLKIDTKNARPRAKNGKNGLFYRRAHPRAENEKKTFFAKILSFFEFSHENSIPRANFENFWHFLPKLKHKSDRYCAERNQNSFTGA